MIYLNILGISLLIAVIALAAITIAGYNSQSGSRQWMDFFDTVTALAQLVMGISLVTALISSGMWMSWVTSTLGAQ